MGAQTLPLHLIVRLYGFVRIGVRRSFRQRGAPESFAYHPRIDLSLLSFATTSCVNFSH